MDNKAGKGMIEAEYEEIDDAVEEAVEDELDLTEDDSLPWLESDEEETGGGFDLSQFVGFAVILLALLGALLFGIWYFSNQSSDRDLVADGSTIEAEDGPYKVKPDEPGGKEFEGTGNVAPGVGEGETPDGRMADSSSGGNAGASSSGDGAKPSISTRSSSEGAGSSGGAAVASGAGSAASATGVGVQVGAYTNKADAEAGWKRLTASSDALNGVRYRVVKGTADFGTVYRLQAVPGDRAAADKLCSALKADGLPCQVKP